MYKPNFHSSLNIYWKFNLLQYLCIIIIICKTIMLKNNSIYCWKIANRSNIFNWYISVILKFLIFTFFHFQITYHEVEPSGFEQNADSSSIYVAEEYFSLSNLQPGRNYSISVKAVSKGIESVERSLFQATRKLLLVNHW